VRLDHRERHFLSLIVDGGTIAVGSRQSTAAIRRRLRRHVISLTDKNSVLRHLHEQ
jgi:hypothetical protein